MLYEDSQIILASVEAHMLGVSELKSPFLKSMWCQTGGALKYIMCGLREFFRHGRKFYCWQFIMLAVCATIVSLLPIEARQLVSLPLTSLMLLGPVFFTAFPVPSTYAHGGVTSSDVEHAMSVISAIGVSGNALETLKANVEILEQPVKQRVSRLQLGLTGLWGFWGYWFWSFLQPSSPIAYTVGGVSALAVYSILLLTFFLLVQGYGNAHSVLFTTIRLAINEHMAAPKEPQPALQSEASDQSSDACSPASQPPVLRDEQSVARVM